MRLTLLELFGDGIKKGTKGSVQHIITGNKETLRVWGDEEAVLIAIAKKQGFIISYDSYGGQSILREVIDGQEILLRIVEIMNCSTS